MAYPNPDPVHYDTFRDWYASWKRKDSRRRTNERMGERFGVSARQWRQYTHVGPNERRPLPPEKLDEFVKAYEFDWEAHHVLELLLTLDDARGAAAAKAREALLTRRRLRVLEQARQTRPPPPGHWLSAAILELPRVRVVPADPVEVSKALVGSPDPRLVGSIIDALLRQGLLTLNAAGQIVAGEDTSIGPTESGDATPQTPRPPRADINDAETYARHMSILDRARESLEEGSSSKLSQLPRVFLGVTVALNEADWKELEARARDLLKWAFSRTAATEPPDRVVHAEVMLLPLTQALPRPS